MQRLSVSLEKNRKNNQGRQLTNQYSYLNLKREPHDQINLFNVELEKMKKRDFALPSISTQRRNILMGIAEKLNLVKARLKQRQTVSHSRNSRTIYTDRLSPYPFPFPLQYPPPPPPMPYPPPPPYPYPQAQGCCPQCHHKKPKKHRKNKKKKQKKQEPQPEIPVPVKKRNKFRIYTYAVYFCIFFPCYSKKFTENRKKWFDDRYNKTDKNIIYLGSEQVLKRLQQIDFYQLSLDSKINKHITGGESPVIDWQDYTKTALVPSTTFHKTSTNGESTSQYLINLTQLLLTKLGQMITQQQFVKQYHEVFSAGSLDLSFMIDNLYLPEETPFLFIHPVKGYLRLNEQEQLQILLVKVIVKMFIYNFLIGLYRVKSWNKRLEHQHKLAQYQIEEVWEVTRTIAIYLYIICKEMYVQGVQNLSHKSNFYQFYKKFGIKQAKHLEEVKIIENEEDQKKEKPFQLIRNMRNYEITYQKLCKNNRLMEYKSVIKQKIVDLLSNLHEKLKNEERQFFNYIKNMTLAVPYLILSRIAKQKQEQTKKQRQYKILKPNEKNGKAWHELYSNSSYLNSSFESEKNKTKKSRFEQENQKQQKSLRMTKTGHMNSNLSRIKDAESKRVSFEDTKQNRSIEVLKSNQMKKPFNIDTVNGKYDRNRQDRLRQKFRNYLAEK